MNQKHETWCIKIGALMCPRDTRSCVTCREIFEAGQRAGSQIDQEVLTPENIQKDKDHWKDEKQKQKTATQSASK